MMSASSLFVVTLSYDDLKAFDPSHLDEKLLNLIGQAFGKEGLGILAVRGVPDFVSKREALLPLAARLPYLPDLEDCIDEKSLYSIGWSHGKEALSSGQPDTAKGSFYIHPLVEDIDGENRWPTSLPALKDAACDMSNLLYQIGCQVADVCDSYCRKHGAETNIADTLRRSRNSKGRLLHYFAVQETAPAWCAWHNDHVRSQVLSVVG